MNLSFNSYYKKINSLDEMISYNKLAQLIYYYMN